MHGLPRAFESGSSLLRRILWVIASVLGLILAIYLASSSITGYFDNETTYARHDTL